MKTEHKVVYYLNLFIFLILSTYTWGQLAKNWIPESELSLRLDSISKSGNIEGHFAEIYVMATIAADKYIATLPDTPKMLLNRLQQEFANRFFESIEGKRNNHIPEVWKRYYTYPELNDIQLKLIGTNNHINGDSWQVLFNHFSLPELIYIEPYYDHCTEELQVVLDSLHQYCFDHHKRLRLVHQLSLGLDKIYARHLLTKWRKRQYNMALAGFQNQNRFLRMKIRVNRKARNTDYLIRHLLN